jgi:hyperosmotically inducible periplasmic protein
MKSLTLVCVLASVLSAAPLLAGAQDADNTGRNVQDRDDQTLTPGDQGGSAADREVTANVRKAIVADDALSMNAHNVKVITLNGVVTLRGPVKNAAEKSSVAAKAQKVAGVKRVDNQLEIEKN